MHSVDGCITNFVFGVTQCNVAYIKLHEEIKQRSMRAYVRCSGSVAQIVVVNKSCKTSNYKKMLTSQWFEAAIKGDAKTIQTLSSTYVSTSDCYGRTALMLASSHNRISVVKILLNKEHGMHDMQYQTALMYATSAGHPEVVELLLPYEYLIKTGDQKSALYYAIEFNKPECVKLLLPHLFTDTYRGLRPLALAIFLKCYDMVRFFLQENNLLYISLDELTQARDIANATQDTYAIDLLNSHENKWQLSGKFVAVTLQAEPVATYTPVVSPSLTMIQPAVQLQTDDQISQQDSKQPIEYLDDDEYETVNAVISTKERNTRLQTQLSKGIKMVEFKLVNDYLQDLQMDMLGGNTEHAPMEASGDPYDPALFPTKVLESNIPRGAWILYCKQQALRRLRDEQTLNDTLSSIEAHTFSLYNSDTLEEMQRKRRLISGFLSKSVEELLELTVDEYVSQSGTVESMLGSCTRNDVVFQKESTNMQTFANDSVYNYNSKMSRMNRRHHAMDTHGTDLTDATDIIDESVTENTTTLH